MFLGGIFHKKKKEIDGFETDEELSDPVPGAGLQMEADSTVNPEYEIVEREIHPAKIICPDCGGITLEGLDFCDKCGGEL